MRRALAVVAFVASSCAGGESALRIAAPVESSTTTAVTSTTLDTGPVASVAVQPERRAQIQVTPTEPPPSTTTVPTGINGLPFAPAGLTGCDRMAWYSDQAGLPEQFHWIGYEESRCDNRASSWCCHGYFQIHEGWVDWAPRQSRERCDVTSAAQFDQRTPIARQRNACMARLVYDEQGFCAWDVVPWC